MSAALGPLAQRMLLAGGSALIGRSRTVAALLDWHEHNGSPRRHVWPKILIMGRRTKPKALPPGIQAFRLVEPARIVVDSFAPPPVAEVDRLFAVLQVGDLEWVEAPGGFDVARLLTEASAALLAGRAVPTPSPRAGRHNLRENARRKRALQHVPFRRLLLEFPRFGGAT